MLSTVDLERLIAVKRREIEKEKTRLGLAPLRSDCQKHDSSEPTQKKNETSTTRPVSEGAGQHDAVEEEGEIEDIPPDLERYIRIVRCLDPAMQIPEGQKFNRSVIWVTFRSPWNRSQVGRRNQAGCGCTKDSNWSSDRMTFDPETAILRLGRFA